MNNKKLYRSNSNKIIAGVCGGLAEFLDIDATLLRLIWVLIVVFTGFFPGALVYIIAAVIMPQETQTNGVSPTNTPPPPADHP